MFRLRRRCWATECLNWASELCHCAGLRLGIIIRVEMTVIVSSQSANPLSNRIEAERLLLAQAAGQIGTWEWDPVRDFRRLSPELHRLFGTEPEDPEHAEKWAKRVYPDDWEKVQQCMSEGRRTGEMDFEYRYLHPQKGLRWFYCKGRSFGSEAPMLGIVQDITERKKMEGSLGESEERYRTVAETASDAILIIDEDSTICFANSATAEVFGYKQEELVGKNLTMLMPDSMRHLHETGVQRYVASGKRHLNWDGTELPGLHKNGREIPLEVSFGEYTQAGKHYFTGFARDISQRKLAEQALRESEQQLRVVTEATPVMIWMSGTDKLCYYFNKSWLDFVGRTLEQELGNGWAENVHPEDFDRCLQIYVASFDARQPFEMEYRLRHRSGEYRWILDHGVPRFTDNGTFEGYIGGCLDIHEQKEAAEKVRIAVEALQESEQRLRRLAAIVESSDDAIVSKDLNGIVTSWNQQAERLFGYKPEEMIGRSILTIIPPELHGDEDMILSRIRAGRQIEHFETTRVAKSGERIDVSISISPVRDEHGNIIGAAKIARDIREKRKIERALRISEKLAAAGRLASTVAHEINNPLEAVTNLLYLTRSTTDRTALRSFLAQADEELKRAAFVSRQTLGLYRERNGVKPLRLGSIIEPLVFVFQTKAKNKSIHIRSEVRQDPEINAIESELRHAIANLLNNSVDAIFSGGTICVRVSAGRAWDGTSRCGVRVTVADTGRGINREHRAKLFEPFFTADKDVGTGLGLWISKEIVERHRGYLRFKSWTNPGRSGTVFTIFLPSDSLPRSVES